LEQARLPTWRLWARDAAIEKKDALKARCYTWSPGEFGRPKCWYRDVSDANREAEAAWLRANVMGRDQAVWALRIRARDRYSDRCWGWGEPVAGQRIARQVLELVGGYKGLSGSGLPFDRGDANHALVTLFLKVADAIEEERLEFAERLRAEALKLGTTQAQPGSATRYLAIGPLLQELSESWRGLDSPIRATIKATDDLVGELGEILDRIRVLFVSCSPSDATRLRVDSEQRAIIEAINSGPSGNVIEIKVLPAATIEDLRRALGSEFEIVQFWAMETRIIWSSKLPMVRRALHH
jgi:hypothetical protein